MAFTAKDVAQLRERTGCGVRKHLQKQTAIWMQQLTF